MTETLMFGNEEREDHMEAARKGGKPWVYRPLSEINHEEAQNIIRKLERRRRDEGTSTRIGRIGLSGGVGTNRPERVLRPEYQDGPPH